MRTGRIAFTATALLASTSGASAQRPDPAHAGHISATYQVSVPSFLLRSGDHVGAKRSGSFCLPSGGIEWREVKPDAAEAAAVIARRLESAGLDARSGGDGPSLTDGGGVQIISGEVTALRLSACVPPGGLGRLLNRSKVIKGEGSIIVRWRLLTAAGQPLTPDWQAETAFTYRESGAALSDMVLTGVARAADDLASQLKQRQGS